MSIEIELVANGEKLLALTMHYEAVGCDRNLLGIYLALVDPHDTGVVDPNFSEQRPTVEFAAMPSAIRQMTHGGVESHPMSRLTADEQRSIRVHL
ncbi:hypothetical protein AA0498_0525 [Acidomonas methanolica]|nr:hypothetical protein AA0498_0525 [Acidomonas methanolica]